MLSEMLETFVGGETRTVRRDFKQHAAWFAEIQCPEVEPVDDRGDVHAGASEMLLPLAVFFVIGRAKGDMMNATNAGMGTSKTGIDHHVHFGSEPTRPRLIDQNLLTGRQTEVTCLPEPEHGGKNLFGRFAARDYHSEVPKAPNRMFDRHGTISPGDCSRSLAGD